MVARTVTLDALSALTGKSLSQVSRDANREGWQAVYLPVRGGQAKHFLVHRLPEEIRRRILATDSLALPAIAPQVATGLAHWQRECLQARLAVLAYVKQIEAEAGTEQAIRDVVAMAKAGMLPASLQAIVGKANARAGKDRSLSRPRIYDWRREFAERGELGLVPQEARKAPVEQGWERPLLRLRRRSSKPSLKSVLEDLPAELPEGVPMPSYDQARRFIASLAPTTREKGRRSRNAMLALQGHKRRSTAGLMPMDVVTADGHTFKAKIAHPVHGKPFRPEVCVFVDVRTRLVVGWSAGLAESTWVVMDAARNAVEHLGQFAGLFTDNGSGFVNECLTGETIGVLARLGATPIHAMPGRAQSRGKVERIQSSLWIRAAKKFASYCGDDMDGDAEKKVVKLVDRQIKLRGSSPLLPSWEDFLERMRGEIVAYNNRPHRGLPKVRDAVTGKLRHQSPVEALEQAKAEGWAPLMLPAALLDDCFRPYEHRVTRRGEVSLPWGRYYAQELVDWHGQRVAVGYDIHDGSRVWVRDRAGRLVAVAERDGNVIPELPENKAEQIRDTRARGRQKLLERHLEEVELERRGGRVLDLVATPLDPEAARLAEARFLELEAEEAAPAALPAPATAERPTFVDEEDWARWVLANPDKSLDSDRALLARRMASPSFRLLLGLDGDAETDAAAG